MFAFVLESVAERRVARGGTDHWCQPAPFRALVRERTREGASEMERRRAQRSRSVTGLMIGGGVLIVLLAGYGFSMLAHYAK